MLQKSRNVPQGSKGVAARPIQRLDASPLKISRLSFVAPPRTSRLTYLMPYQPAARLDATSCFCIFSDTSILPVSQVFSRCLSPPIVQRWGACLPLAKVTQRRHLCLGPLRPQAPCSSFQTQGAGPACTAERFLHTKTDPEAVACFTSDKPHFSKTSLSPALLSCSR